MSEELDEKVQQKLLLYQRLQAEAEAILKNMGALEAALLDYQKAIMTLGYLIEHEGELESLVNIGGGTYVYSKVKSGENILIEVGKDVIIEKSPSDAKKILEERKEKIVENINTLNQQINQIYNQMQVIQQDLATSGKKR